MHVQPGSEGPCQTSLNKCICIAKPASSLQDRHTMPQAIVCGTAAVVKAKLCAVWTQQPEMCSPLHWSFPLRQVLLSNACLFLLKAKNRKTRDVVARLIQKRNTQTAHLLAQSLVRANIPCPASQAAAAAERVGPCQVHHVQHAEVLRAPAAACHGLCLDMAAAAGMNCSCWHELHLEELLAPPRQQRTLCHTCHGLYAW